MKITKFNDLVLRPTLLSFQFLIVCATLGGSLPTKASFEPMLDETAIDHATDPCDDFQRYACGKWTDNAVIPADKAIWLRSFSTIYEENLKTNRKLLEDFAASKNLGMSHNAQKLGDFYGACMDLKKIAAETPAFLKGQFAHLDNLTLETLSQTIGDLQALEIGVFFNYGSDQDLDDSSQMIATIDQGGLGLPGRDYYFEPNKADIREKYVPHIARMLELSGIAADEAKTQASEILKFETALAEKALRPVERRDAERLYHMKSLAELKELTPAIQWETIFQATESPKFTSINVAVVEYFSNLSAMITKTPLPILKSYLRWRMISAFGMDLGGDYAKERFDFYQKTLQGQKEMKTRWKFCVDQADGSLADALGEAFVAKTFGKDSKKKALNILSSLQKVFEKNFDAIDWMDEETRQYAVEKLHLFVKKIGYPDKWRDLRKLKINRDHMANALSASSFDRDWDLSKIGKPTDRTEWHMTPPTVNAYYNPASNEIVFPAGVLQSPMFNAKAPLAANYGAFGVIIGHEMTHAFDDQGKKFDIQGNFKNWWTPFVEATFQKKGLCLVEQFSQYTVADGIHVDGQLTLGENIADLGGVKMSLAALASTWPKDFPDASRIEEEKKFFTAYAQIWCSKATPEIQRLRAAQDTHSPEKYRVNGVLSNTPEFARAYGCSAKKPLAPENRCNVW